MRFDPWQVRAGQEEVLPGLWQYVWCWPCSDGELALRAFALERMCELPAWDGQEAMLVGLAQAQTWAERQAGTCLLMLDEPARCLGPERMRGLQGFRLLGIRSAADQACWDAALSQGVAAFGIAGDVQSLSQQADPQLAARTLFSDLCYGAFTSGIGVDFVSFQESPQGCTWQLPVGARLSVLVAGGLEVATLDDQSSGWQDRGSEGYVRLVLQQGVAQRFTQPRLVAPRQSSAEACG